MLPGQQFSFIVSADTASRMDRVVLINDGKVVSKLQDNGDMVYTVERT